MYFCAEGYALANCDTNVRGQPPQAPRPKSRCISEPQLRLAVCVADVVARCPAVTFGMLQVLGFRPLGLEQACLQSMLLVCRNRMNPRSRELQT